MKRAAGQPVRDAFATAARSPARAHRGPRARRELVSVITVPAAAMSAARALAGGDVRRIAVQRDGSVIVTNHPR